MDFDTYFLSCGSTARSRLKNKLENKWRLDCAEFNNEELLCSPFYRKSFPCVFVRKVVGTHIRFEQKSPSALYHIMTKSCSPSRRCRSRRQRSETLEKPDKRSGNVVHKYFQNLVKHQMSRRLSCIAFITKEYMMFRFVSNAPKFPYIQDLSKGAAPMDKNNFRCKLIISFCCFSVNIALKMRSYFYDP